MGRAGPANARVTSVAEVQLHKGLEGVRGTPCRWQGNSIPGGGGGAARAEQGQGCVLRTSRRLGWLASGRAARAEATRGLRGLSRTPGFICVTGEAIRGF